MTKKFTYYKIRNEIYNESTDEIEYFGEEFDYEVDSKSLMDALADVLYELHFSFCKDEKQGKKAIMQFIMESDTFEQLCETYEEDLKDYFEEEALEEWDL